MTQSTLNRLQKDIEKIYNNLKKKNLFKQIFSVLHKVLSVESQMVITPNNGCIKGIFNGCSHWTLNKKNKLIFFLFMGSCVYFFLYILFSSIYNIRPYSVYLSV